MIKVSIAFTVHSNALLGVTLILVRLLYFNRVAVNAFFFAQWLIEIIGLGTIMKILISTFCNKIFVKIFVKLEKTSFY